MRRTPAVVLYATVSDRPENKCKSTAARHIADASAVSNALFNFLKASHEDLFRHRIASAALVSLFVFSSPAYAHMPQAQPPGIARTDLQRHDLTAPGREVVQVRVDFAPGVVAPKHSHPGEEIAYAIEGLLECQLEGKPPVTLKAVTSCSSRPERTTR
ncbi:hypothetical protein SAMN05444679_10454 [Variovorax sp. CF079]|uniref:cupin domain-containing protein n=1 Tax=Variovorax sp. CF079 TaxID=1882774 RepID=UPI00088B2AC9|nr:cupin domain-containing protein [Variovorax sp. CF079]SDC59355.1 hypothetical protein SAMN05444679_10454 [Variovorax sp. CF079]